MTADSSATVKYASVAILSTLLVFSFCLAIVYLFLVDYDPRLFLVSWRNFEHLPYDVKDGTELAAKSDPFKRSSLSLVCTDAGTLHLALLSRMPARTYLRPSSYDDATVFVDGIDRQLDLEKAELVDIGVVDTLVTGPLSPIQLDRLATWFGSSPPAQISFHTMERAVYLAGVTSGESIRIVAGRCIRT